jgi:hypothetical protein
MEFRAVPRNISGKDTVARLSLGQHVLDSLLTFIHTTAPDNCKMMAGNFK